MVFSVLDGFARGAGRGAPPPRMDNRSWALLMASIFDNSDGDVYDFIICKRVIVASDLSFGFDEK